MKRSTQLALVLSLSAGTVSAGLAQQNTQTNKQNAQANKGEVSSDKQNASSKNNKSGTNQTGEDAPVVVTVTTVAFAESTGCWVRIYDGHNYTGRVLTLMGEQSLPHLEFGTGFDWEGDIDSIEVGPKAKLVLFEDERYRDKKRELKPSDRVPDLHADVFSEGVESLKLTCS